MKIKKLARYFCIAVKYALAAAVSPFVKNRLGYGDLWIISERGFDARDNAYYLFKYIRENHPEINIYYIISKNSADRSRAESLGNVINYKSFRHYIAFAASKVKISTHIMGFSPDINFFTHIDKIGLVRGKKIFLQHGIIKDDIPYLYYNNTGLDLFVCSAKAETEYIRENYGYPDGIVELLGLCRYDYLVKNTEKSKKVLFMPTWRVNLQNISREEFLKSQYYTAVNSFLNSDDVEKVLEKHGYELLFYPHIEVQRFLDCFKTEKRHIKILGFDDITVQKLLIDCDVLITDFSSVFFDFGYMEKPMIFYQFDREEFRKHHYREGYFKYERDAFGIVTENEKDVIEELDKILEHDAATEKEYLDRINSFFTFRDRNNCKRNFEKIMEIVK